MTLTRPELDGLADLLDAEVDAAVREAARPRYNVAPGQPHPIVVAPGVAGPRARIVLGTWGLPTTQKKHLPNVRAETAATRFAAAWEGARAVVPADGFYEWSGTGSARRPSWLTPTEGPLLLAGLWRRVGPELRFAVITVAANEDVAPLHDRMPAMLTLEHARRWLEDADPGLIAPAPAGALVARRVSSRVNSVANDDPACLEPDDGRGQLSLL